MMLILFTASVVSVSAQDEMSREEWEKQMNDANARKLELQAQMAKADSTVAATKAALDKATADASSCEDALYAMLGVTRADVEAYDKELTGMESRVSELQRMSDAELMNHKDEIGRMETRVTEMSQSKIALIPRYGNRVSALQAKIAALAKTLQREKTYTVGTWSRDRDCLWNIAKKPEHYNNAWLWPKIWQGNREMITDPDVIQPGWVLKIPEGAELSKEEQSAANRYYRSKAEAAEPSQIP
jgi:nucleoid-associated protein YgaU